MRTPSERFYQNIIDGIAAGGLFGGSPDEGGAPVDEAPIDDGENGVPQADLDAVDESDELGEPEEVESGGVKAKGRVLKLRSVDADFLPSPEGAESAKAKLGSLDALLKSFDAELEPAEEPEFKLPEGTDPGVVKAFDALSAKLKAATPAAPQTSPEEI